VKYVALLAFEKIVTSHPHLVSLHQDVILECIDDPDISIRIRALNLVVGMVNSENLTLVVDRLLKQLLASPLASDDPANEHAPRGMVEPYAESDEEDAEESLKQHEVTGGELPPLPEAYKTQVIRNILDVSSKDTYSNLNDFEWYIGVLVKLVKACPMVKTQTGDISPISDGVADVSYDIGRELQNIAVRVKSMRPETTAAAQSLVMIDNRDTLFPSFSTGGQRVLESCGWLVGEYADQLTNPDGVLNSLLHSSTTQLPSHIIAIYLQAMLKVFAVLSGNQHLSWTSQRRANTTLLIARIIYFLEPFTAHPDLEVQELAVEYLELMRLASEGASGQGVSHEGEYVESPLLLSQAIPALFNGGELNPVATGAQKKVQPPNDLDLESPINENLQSILKEADSDALEVDNDEMEDFYYKQEDSAYIPESAADRLDLAAKADPYSYQVTSDDDRLDPDALTRKRVERNVRNKDDPFYIGSEEDVSASSRLHNIIKSTNGDDLDIDSIPIMDLNLEGVLTPDMAAAEHERAQRFEQQRRAEKRKKIQIVRDETLGEDDPVETDSSRQVFDRLGHLSKPKKSLLYIDSSGLGSLSLDNGTSNSAPLDIEQREAEDKALREVEQLRLEMQRASERIQPGEEGKVIKKKRTTKNPSSKSTTGEVHSSTIPEVDFTGEEASAVVKKKKKKKKPVGEDASGELVKPKKHRGSW
jgi:AP-3 complex subunit delta